MTEEQAWKIFNADVNAATGPDKAKGGVMAMVRAARAEAIEECARLVDEINLHQAALVVLAEGEEVQLLGASAVAAQLIAEAIREIEP